MAAGLGTLRVDGKEGHTAGDTARGAGEGARIAERLQVQQRQVGAPVGLPPLEHVVVADVVLVAERDEAGHADAEPLQTAEQCDTDPAGLHGDPGEARRGVGGGEGGVEADPVLGVGQAPAVGADEAHVVITAG
ncbi:hypothetical protein GCM10023097_71170 [Streptomyces collinus]|uniref:Uncharacterized protein n=1 Tax=Streptomyces collinus TaxID=42684 RepID=A0AA89QGK2_STRCU|nr:hypothetical protein [Streptomyces collinus]